ncbi:RNA-binding (RRM/RBD/RNP motifs) family protein [Trifolium repens]|nr:RNA-binding (RRM/RBD/RNP motifs) family protein [Trifolium repens]
MIMKTLNGANFLLDLSMHFAKSGGFFFHFLQAASHLVELLHTTGFIVGGGHVNVSFHLCHVWDLSSVNLMLFLVHLSIPRNQMLLLMRIRFMKEKKCIFFSLYTLFFSFIFYLFHLFHQPILSTKFKN